MPEFTTEWPPPETLEKWARELAKESNQERWARKVADRIGSFLRQEYKFADGEWWLYSLGAKQRQLTDDEVKYARERGLIT